MSRERAVLRPEERPWGALAHLFAAVPFWGILFNLVLWIHFKERSRLMLFHLQQAMMFQAMLLALLVPLVLAKLLGALIGFLFDGAARFFNALNVLMASVGITAYVAVCLYAAYRTYSGAAFFYPIFGRRMFDGAMRKTTAEE